MFGYHLTLAWRSLRRNPVLTSLMVLLIGVGVAACMTTWAALRAVSGDPVPGKSAHLFVPQIDNQGGDGDATTREPPRALSYIDAMALLHAKVAPQTTVAAPLRTAVIPDDAAKPPIAVTGYATTEDFFSMFAVPFRFGGGWSEANGGDGVVIGEQINRSLFGNADSVGRSINLGGHVFRIVGVLGDWNPQPRFYAGADVNALADDGAPPQLFVPFARAAALQAIGNAGSMSCPPAYHGNGWRALLASECDWISAWVALPTAADVARYRSFLEGYAAEQQRLGRFHWAANVRLRNLPDWLASMHAVPQANRIAVQMAFGLLVVCLLNAMGLLLARFMRRRGEIGIRRALGASRVTIMQQCLTEAALVGAAGGSLGIVLTAMGMAWISALFGARIARLAHVDLGLLAGTVLLALGATLLAAALPAWQAASVPPLRQLKSQ